MMTAQGDGEKRLAEIFREIFALSETNQSKSALTDNSIESLDTQRATATSETSKGKHAGDQNDPDEQEIDC